jgi:hypothetical protein
MKLTTYRFFLAHFYKIIHQFSKLFWRYTAIFARERVKRSFIYFQYLRQQRKVVLRPAERACSIHWLIQPKSLNRLSVIIQIAQFL